HRGTIKSLSILMRPDGPPPRLRDRCRARQGGLGPRGGGVPPRKRPLRRPRVLGRPRLLRPRGSVRLRGPRHVEQPRRRARRARPSLQVYEALVRADSGNAVAWTRKGQLLEELNKFDEAVDAYHAATSQDPQDGDAWTGLGDALYALERYEEAVEAYDRAIAA